MTDPAEEPLLNAAAAGNERAFEELYARYEARVRLVAWRTCKRPEVVDDLVNETWCRAYHQRSSYDPQRSFLGWLGGILHNVWREHARTTIAERERLAAVNSGLDSPNMNGDSPESAIAEAEMLAGLNDCVERLEPEERDIIRWRFFEGQSLRAMAQRLKIAEATLRENRLPPIMARIERCLRAKGLGDAVVGIPWSQAADP